MAKTRQLPFFLRPANGLMTLLLRLGFTPGLMALLTVNGRKSGKPRTTPVAVIEQGGKQYLIAAYGIVDWVRNLRAAREGTITRGRRSRRVSAVELSPAEGAPILKAALAEGPSFLRSYFDATPTSPLADYEREVPRHPVFELVDTAVTPSGNAARVTVDRG